MTRSDLIALISQDTDITKESVNRMLKSFADIVTQKLSEGERIELSGFGVFDVVTRAARKGHNLRTGEPIEIPEHKVATFKPGKRLKHAVRG